ncbi:hypothetical protein SBA3_1210038 [Candidatus Sulfopaludibacter sp. SbA3]|nr:hypothetical protein SBA3_1210038 [Candidatus Sulfopaludibacter sp. SbA3]
MFRNRVDRVALSGDADRRERRHVARPYYEQAHEATPSLGGMKMGGQTRRDFVWGKLEPGTKIRQNSASFKPGTVCGGLAAASLRATPIGATTRP